MISFKRLVVCLFIAGIAVAEEATPPAAAPAEPPVEAQPLTLAPEEVTLRFNESLGDGVSGSIVEQANIELLNVDQLRALYERQSESQILRLSLADCIALAVKQNNDILIAEFEPLISDADIYTAKGEFDPVWQTDMQYLNAQQSLNQQAVAFGGIDSVRQYQTTINSTVGGKLHTGTQYALVFALSKEENTFGGFIEEFNTSLSLQLTQPLLRGAGIKYNKFRIRAARNLRESNTWQLRLSVMNTAAQVIKAYWDVVGATEAVKVADAAMENAKRLLNINETRREIGTAADLEVLQAKAGVSTRQSDLVTAIARAADAGDLLKQVLDLRDGAVLSKARIIPLDRPANEEITLATPEAFDAQMDASVNEALENRPEIKMAALAIDSAEMDADRSRRDLLPQVDLTGSISQGGRNHYLSDSLYATRRGDDSAFTYGIQAGIPLGNRAARGQHQRAELRAKQAEQQLEKARTGVMMSVHLAVRNAESNRVLVKTNAQAVQLQEANVAAEEERLRLGVTTSWQVLQIQEALTAARTQQLQSRIAYEKALVDLQLAKGTLLGDIGIEYVAPDPEEPVGYFEGYKVGVGR